MQSSCHPDRPLRAKGLCNRCYRLQWRHNRGENIKYKRPPDISLIRWIKMHSILTDTGCHIWTLSCDTSGYGQIQDPAVKKVRSIVRIVWEAVHGTIPEGLGVLHHCDNPPCNNIDHLWIGTHLENMKDRDAKGRGRNGASGLLIQTGVK